MELRSLWNCQKRIKKKCPTIFLIQHISKTCILRVGDVTLQFFKNSASVAAVSYGTVSYKNLYSLLWSLVNIIRNSTHCAVFIVLWKLIYCIMRHVMSGTMRVKPKNTGCIIILHYRFLYFCSRNRDHRCRIQNISPSSSQPSTMVT